MANKPEPSPLSKLVDKALESTVGLLVVFILSTALIAGIGYILFESRAELLDILQQNPAVTKSGEDDFLFEQVTRKFLILDPDSGRISEISSVVFHLSLSDQISSAYAEAASQWCRDTAQKYKQIKSEIEALVSSDQLALRFQSSTMKLIESEIAQLDLLSDALTNWNRASATQRTNYYEDEIKVQSEKLKNQKAYSVQAEQVTQRLTNEGDDLKQQSYILKSRLEIWQTRKDLTPIGIIVGLLTLFGLFVLMLYKVRHR
jgi:hypothetical protein